METRGSGFNSAAGADGRGMSSGGASSGSSGGEGITAAGVPKVSDRALGVPQVSVCTC